MDEHLVSVDVCSDNCAPPESIWLRPSITKINTVTLCTPTQPHTPPAESEKFSLICQTHSSEQWQDWFKPHNTWMAFKVFILFFMTGQEELCNLPYFKSLHELNCFTGLYWRRHCTTLFFVLETHNCSLCQIKWYNHRIVTHRWLWWRVYISAFYLQSCVIFLCETS